MALTLLTFPNANPVNGATNVTPIGADETNGNKIQYSKNMILFFQETGGTNPSTITITSNPNSEGKSKTTALVLTASGEGFIGPLDEDFSKDGYIEMTFTGTGTIEVSPLYYIPA
jgi:hypothetical protein